MEIKTIYTTTPKVKPTDETALGFGQTFTDHMFQMDYTPENGWHNARIVPYGPLLLDPASTSLHYAQLIFEGMKAYQSADGRILMFRPWENMKRINRSGERLCIPPAPEEELLNGIVELVKVEKDWIPTAPETSLYIRPFIVSTDAVLGVSPSKNYLLTVILSPVGAYYKGGIKPVKIYVEDEYVRAVRGGTGEAKCAGNYASSLRAQVNAVEQGYAQVLWLDGVHRKYIEEVGSMNVFFVIDGVVVTPELSGSILPGVTRESVIQIVRDWGIPVEERAVTIDELAKAYDEGKLTEAFGTGTAAVISPIGELKWGDKHMEIGGGEIGKLSQRLYDEISGIRTGAVEDTRNWIYTAQ